MKRTTVMLPPDLRARINAHARDLNISLGEFLRLAAETYLMRQVSPRQADPLAGDDFVVREDAPPDISANIDRYLYGSNR